MDAGHLSRECDHDEADEKIDASFEKDDYVDGFGNVHNGQRKKAISEKELKRLKKQKALHRKKGDDLSNEEDEDLWYEKLQEKVGVSESDKPPAVPFEDRGGIHR